MGSFHHGMANFQIGDGRGDLQRLKVMVNLLNRQSQAANSGWFSSLGVGKIVDNFSPSKFNMLQNVTQLMT
jgi:hypothetical protein